MTSKMRVTKPNFYRMLFDRVLLVGLIIIIAGMGVFSYLEGEYYKAIAEIGASNYSSIEQIVVNELMANPSEEELSRNTLNWISWMTAWMPVYNGTQVEVILDGDVICDNSDRALVYLDSAWYICRDEDVIKGLAQYKIDFFSPPSYAFVQHNQDVYSPGADRYYVNDETLEFRPGTVDGVNYAPADLSGWREVMPADDFNVIYVAGDLGYPEQHSGNHASKFTVNGTDHKIQIRCSDQLLNTDFAFHERDVIAKLFLAAVVLILAISFLWSGITYYRQKAVYDLIEYRTGLTSKLAHDLKTPLMVMSTSAEYLAVCSDKEKDKQYRQQILDNVYYMNDMIANVLQLSASEHERIIHDTNEVNVSLIIDNILEKMNTRIEEKKLTVDKSAFSQIYPKTDSSILSNALTCIIENAVKYATEGTKIIIANSGNTICTVTNEFAGTIENADSLTEPFVRGTGERGEMGGTGLGLAIARKDLADLSMKLEIQIADNRFTVTVR